MDRTVPTAAAAERRRRAQSFAGVAEEYERGRPGYPPQAIDWLLGRAPLQVLDLGAGTGKLTAAVLAGGHRVVAVEPLAEMRAILMERVPCARVLEGAAEQLPLADASVDAVVVGAAFHWFDQARALAEVERVLRPPGILGLLGNTFDTSLAWVASLREILGPPAVDRRGHWPAPEVLRERFEEVAEERFPHHQEVDLAMLRDLASSRSTVAVLEPAERAKVLDRIGALWSRSPELQGRQTVTLPWLARVCRCRGVRTAPAWEAVAVSAEEVRPLRGEVLRAGRPAHEWVFEGDGDPQTLHLAVRLADRVVSVASVMREDCPRLRSASAWRVRGMASAPQARGRGMGAALLAACERHAREHGGTLLWCYARVPARTLYERAGMTALGEPFEIPPIGPHELMYKPLRQPSG